jgi:hypothetical protein
VGLRGAGLFLLLIMSLWYRLDTLFSVLAKAAFLETGHLMKNALSSAAILSILLLYSGCDSGEYERQMQIDVGKLQNASAFNALGDEQAVPGTSIKVRLPKNMKLVESSTDPLRTKPGLMDKGLKATYEGFVKDRNGGQQHYYFYAAELPLSLMNNSNPFKAWFFDAKSGLKDSMAGGSTETNNSFSCESPSGDASVWEEFHFQFNSMKFFYLDAGDKPSSMDVPGTFVCMSQVQNDKLYILSWRYPTSFEGQKKDFNTDWIKMVGGCAKLAQ